MPAATPCPQLTHCPTPLAVLRNRAACSRHRGTRSRHVPASLETFPANTHGFCQPTGSTTAESGNSGCCGDSHWQGRSAQADAARADWGSAGARLEPRPGRRASRGKSRLPRSPGPWMVNPKPQVARRWQFQARPPQQLHVEQLQPPDLTVHPRCCTNWTVSEERRQPPMRLHRQQRQLFHRPSNCKANAV
jgi:hypothetical protein